MNDISRNEELEPEEQIVAEAMAQRFPVIERAVSPKPPGFDPQEFEQSDTHSPQDDGDTDNSDG